MSNVAELIEAGRSKRKDGDLEGAINDFQAAYAADESSSEAKNALLNAMYDRGDALKDSGEVQAAVDLWKQVLDIDESHTLSHMALAVHLQKLGVFDDAIKHAVRVTELDPEDPFSFTQLSVIYQRCGRIPEAELARDKAAALAGRTRH